SRDRPTGAAQGGKRQTRTISKDEDGRAVVTVSICSAIGSGLLFSHHKLDGQSCLRMAWPDPSSDRS
ncbi:MAG: hypothetical protein ACK5IP_16515, partial [Paracoccus sp. (in: a-proteobacteria)]